MALNSKEKPMQIVKCMGLQHDSTGYVSGLSIIHARLIRDIAPRLVQEAWVRRHTKAKQSNYTEAINNSDDDVVYEGGDIRVLHPSLRSLRRERNNQGILAAVAEEVAVRWYNNPVIVQISKKECLCEESGEQHAQQAARRKKGSVVQPFMLMTGHKEKMGVTNFALPVDPLTITSMQMIGSSFVDANMSFFALLVAWTVLCIKFAGVHAWSTTSCRLSTCFLMWYLSGSLPMVLLAWLFPCFGRRVCSFLIA